MSPSDPDAPRGTHAAGDHAGDLARAEAALAAELRMRVSVVSLDSLPAFLTATLIDHGRRFTASATEGTPEAKRIVDDVVARAIAVREAEAATPKL